MPVFPGDEVTTSRRGRVEIRMADGNIIALDRSTPVRLQIDPRLVRRRLRPDHRRAPLGHVAIQRDEETRELAPPRHAERQLRRQRAAIYAVEADPRARTA